ncbi:AAA family ATPase [Phenylobacterium sp.]|jgi:chloramphenicol 3-O-phosphotransferase|uniref:AAA family ATPase n=1 Tax=Phenylobacterium sp. TaxID=1871053 RepID=UPI002E308663|nr:AAA family ATPase [Phenylobacterium sp.]HEX2560182.1 AAA family ATPase [Phenylobacterium sp.]
MPPPQVLIVTGAMAAGKSTLAQALAERLERSVHLRGDLFRKMIVSGRALPGEGEEGIAQLKMRYELAVLAAARYANSGFSVVYQDVVLAEDLLDAVRRLKRWRPGVVVLNPPAQVLAQRDRDRDKTGYDGPWSAEGFAQMVAATPRVGLWIDNAELTVSQTVDAILADAEATRAGL